MDIVGCVGNRMELAVESETSSLDDKVWAQRIIEGR